MKYIPILLVLFLGSCSKNKIDPAIMKTALKIGFENNDNTTATYFEAIEYYKMLDEHFSTIRVSEFGMTDSGYPLHEVVVTDDGEYDPAKIRNNGKAILFINNAIHPGEPCGVDASMMLARNLMSSDLKSLLKEVSIVIVPIYNISGALNRGSHSRANQNGPEAYGFRGNGQNLDLNRDFIKSDSDNARSFNRLYTKWSPDVFIDNHTSNGADYQYVMTLIPTQKDKMEKPLSDFMTQMMLPDLYKKMEEKTYGMTPYVYARTIPDDGIAGFLDLPRYSSGYTSLHNSISFMPETHMLKPFSDRVKSTYAFMISMLEHIKEQKKALLEARAKAINTTKTKTEFDINWAVDMEAATTTIFKGYEAKYKKSAITGQNRLYYDQDVPFEKEIPFFNTYKASQTISKPSAYIIPRAYKQIVDKMISNGVEVMRLNKDETRMVEVYRIEDFKTTDNPYEGHYLHHSLEVNKKVEKMRYLKGDYIIYTNQPMNKYIIETLEPQAPDSWFSWNFFDGILMQKEYFSSYVFEDLADELLQKDQTLKAAFEKKKENDDAFAEDARQQLTYIYENSPHYEQSFRRYPVGRVIN